MIGRRSALSWPYSFLTLAFLALTAAVPARAAGGEALTIVTPTGRHAFEVEVMRTQPELERGLMYRRELAPDRGMLFDFGEDKQVYMWMKNTFISLDMIFIDRSGRIATIKENAEPLSERIIPSGVPVRAVLELKGGAARRIGAHPGDRVEQEMFAP